MILENEDIAHLNENNKLIQKKDGFRFGTDAVLLSDFFQGKKSGKALEIGTGNGIISILLMIKEKLEKIDSVEIQEEVAKLAKRNVNLNKFEDRINVICEDIKNIKVGNTYDYIISNPPYMTLDGKPHNEHDTRTIARHEITLNLKELIEKSKKLLKPRGEIFLVHRAYRFTEIARILEDNGFSLKRVQFVYYNKNKQSNLVLVEASKGRKNILGIEPPLILNEE
ncbi:Methyltransferase small domain-containing protein [Cetobacterium ceti]|uniref:Methyltransferase small domain-containing protein n=1 Tax=Cetobacterium ceti TaxID=180163 RepID=A0A1T4KRH5_9FUSO|nr:tRNA1(Val) (adenine(37)-N6)-methyltransferase [Cetobacterium ceti]SJZ44973.1 Methyltransferase small domain-containing protein [Cetobacterium ceti]